jgi:hypothetical protein
MNSKTIKIKTTTTTKKKTNTHSPTVLSPLDGTPVQVEVEYPEVGEEACRRGMRKSTTTLLLSLWGPLKDPCHHSPTDFLLGHLGCLCHLWLHQSTKSFIISHKVVQQKARGKDHISAS